MRGESSDSAQRTLLPFSVLRVFRGKYSPNSNRYKVVRRRSQWDSASLPLFVNGSEHFVDVLVFLLTTEGVVEQLAGFRLAVAEGSQGVEAFAEDVAFG